MATTTTSRRIRRSPEAWEELARELLPEIQDGRTVTDLADRIGSNDEAFRTALARIGYDPQGNQLKLQPITARSRKVLAKRVARRRREGARWWRVMAETGESYGTLTRLLTEFGYTLSGEETSSPNGDAVS